MIAPLTKMMATRSAAAQVAGFIAKFDPAIARHIRASRTAMRRRFPTAVELVYDNYNFLVFGYSATERPSDCVAQIAANAKGVGLAFYYGATLPDPHGVLLGSGTQNRFVRLPTPAAFKTPVVRELIDAAERQARTPMRATGRGYTIVKSISAKQRPRRISAARKPAR